MLLILLAACPWAGAAGAAIPLALPAEQRVSIGAVIGNRLDSVQRLLAIDFAMRDPVRSVDGQAVDLSDVFAFFDSRNREATNNPLPEWRPIVGRVLQITEEGMIVATVVLHGFEEEAARTVYLVQHPKQDRLVDGRFIACFARRNGRMAYADVLGARSTVERWDYGDVPTGEQIDSVLAGWDAAKRAQERRYEQRLAELRSSYSQREQTRKQRELDGLLASAEGGQGWAQFSMGMRYLSGRGVETNRAEALRWLAAACTNGHAQASNELARIANIGP